MTASLLSVTELVSWGVLYYALAVLLDPMARDTGWSAAAISGAFSMALLTAGLAAPAVGAAMDRFGPRCVMSTGSLLGVAGVAGWGSAATLPQLYLAWLLVGVAMACTLYEPAFATIVRYHHRQQRSAILTVSLVGALAATVFQPLTDGLMTARGWRGTVLTLAVVLATVTLPSHLYLPSEASSVRRTGGSRHGASAPATRVPGRATVALALAGGTTVAVTVHLVAFFVHGGVPPTTAAWLAGAVGIAKVFGRIAAAALTRRWSPARVTSWSLAVQAASLLIPVMTWAPPALIVHVCLFGATAGGLTVLRPWLVDHLVGPGAFARRDGQIQLYVSIAKAGGPLLLGVTVSYGVGYRLGWVAGAVVLAVLAHQLSQVTQNGGPTTA